MDCFKEKAQYWASSFSTACIFNSNQYEDLYGSFLWGIAVGEIERFVSISYPDTFQRLQSFLDQYPLQFIPGFLSYDLKDEIEALHTGQPNHQGLAKAFFFVPRNVLLCKEKDIVEVQGPDAEKIIQEIERCQPRKAPFSFQGTIQARTSKQRYTEIFDQMKEHILRGDIYEVNLCQEFYAENVILDAFDAYLHLNELSPVPFSCFFKYDQRFIFSASPERFLKKTGNQLISQPIKGTAKRYVDPESDRMQLEALQSSPKERSENVMIVDLVRHDMTKSALPATVTVKELMGVYSFKQVHQLISTVVCTLQPSIAVTDVLKNTFPPGSMTGAPKVRAMQLIDTYEDSRRGAYAGALGYFYKNDFDFSVVIRSLLYNAENRYLSFLVGGAITAAAEAQAEYKECMLKASAIQALLTGPTPILSPL